MKKILIAVFAVAAGVSAAGAQDRAVNFDGAAVPLPKIERVQGAEAAQAALGGAATPQRMIILGKVDKKSLARLLNEAGRNKTRGAEHCYMGGTEVIGDRMCAMECCDVDTDGDDISNNTYCMPLMDSCSPINPDEDDNKAADKAAIKTRALRLGEMIKDLKSKKKTRGPYEDCVNYCIDEYLGCSGDADPKPCNDRYQRCLNVCDSVVDPKTR